MKTTKSLLVKIMLFILSVTLLTTTAMGWLNYRTSKDIIINSLQDNAESQVTIHASQLGTWLQTRKSEIEVMANIDLVRFGQQGDILRYFAEERARMDGTYSSISIGDTEGNLIFDSGTAIQIGSETTFPDVMAGKSIISNPFPDKADPNNLIISFEVPVHNEGKKVKGLVSGASPINKVFAETTNFNIGKTDIVYVFQNDGLVIHHPDGTKVLQENLLESSSPEMKDLTTEMLKNGQGFSKVTMNGEERMFFYSKVPNTSWIMAVDVPLKEFTSQLTPLLIIAVVSGIAALILNGIILFLLLRKVTNRIRKVATVAEKIAEGNLSLEKIEDYENDEVSHLANGVNQMANNLRDLLMHVHQSTEQVIEASDHFIKGVERASEASEVITSLTLEVSSATVLQLQTIQQNTEAIDQMAIGIQRVASSSSDVSEATTKTEQEAVQGNRSIATVVKQMESIYQSVHKSSDVVRLLASRSKEIGEISGIITSISDQTNLLALNAAIESARAGEHGKGFAVVAEEVRKLAEQSKNSADKISSLIDDIQVNTEEAVQVMSASASDVQEGTDLANHVGEMFNNILEAIKQVSDQIQEVSSSSEQLSASTEEISASSAEMLGIAQKSAQNANIVTTQSSSQLAVIEDMKRATDSLNELINELQKAMGKFTF
ncbi:methyl-accepting chemotaxis protein [Lysinibacillus sp. NPDC096418]|uniref:methyl-accepting chemotaxis protein n=1 Tax=Lysinibacillus sp. NPDC096418 TaxID=3364138 RepID=UPI0038211120